MPMIQTLILSMLKNSSLQDTVSQKLALGTMFSTCALWRTHLNHENAYYVKTLHSTVKECLGNPDEA